MLGLATNQKLPQGLLTISSTGLSGLLGAPLVGQAIDGLPELSIPFLSELAVVGVIFSLDIMAYLSVFVVALVSWFLNQTKPGLVLRSVGINHDSAHALGYQVLKLRFYAVVFGGVMAGLGGAYLPLVLTPHWAGHDSRQRLDCTALVVFAAWRPYRVIVGAILFGAVTIFSFLDRQRAGGNTYTVHVDDAISCYDFRACYHVRL